MSEFLLKPRICFGQDALSVLDELTACHVLLVTDQAMVKFGLAERVTQRLCARGIDWQVWDDVVADPDIATVVRGMKLMDSCYPDLVIALGGGSVIDAAKAVIFALAQTRPEAGRERPCFVAIPTTSGTGSEVTSFSVVKAHAEKLVLVDSSLLPDIAILDPSLVASVPPAITADTGMDVLCHALEAYVSLAASDFSDALAEKVVQQVFSYLPGCWRNGQDLQAREKMHNASCMAGMAFTNASLGITHSLAHALGGVFRVPHGRANALLMAHVVAWNADYHGQCDTLAARKYARLAHLLDLPASTPREGVTSLLVAIQTLKQVFHAESQGDDHYCINLPGAQWRFIAERGIWGWLWIDAQTLRCTDEPVLAQTLLMQLKPVLSMSDATVAEHMQDLYATLLGDLQLLKARRGLSASDLINLDADRLQCLLSGHPKFVFNKGRRGWGKEALERYAPEYTNTFRLHWLAVKREHMIWRCDNDLDIQQLLTAAMDPQEFTRFSQVWQENGLDHNWLPLPVHPWQWQQKIATDFIADFAEGRMVSLGEFGDQWLAQQSLRTLTNASRRGGLDIKLPLTIYNTSCYRGIPGRYIAAGPLASRWLQQVFATDATLVQSGAVILGEPAAGYVSHEGYAALARAPYRYQEMLGVIWRENPCRWLKPDESPVLMATLMECDENNQPLAGAYIDRSGLDAETWLTQLFRVVVVPLYHLLCRYGVALIAHGQNITLAMKEGVPQRVLLKDFQGDMRLVKEAFPEMDSLPQEVRDVTSRLSADYLIHDLQTGHFVTVLRFISPLMVRLGVPERRFYQLLAAVLSDYMNKHPQMAERFALFSLFRPQIIRVVLNPVKLTWPDLDGGSRMLPNYLENLQNPLWLVTQEYES
ncbi:TPA: iron-containing alcohol dehydrogenase [Escherichia coli]|nr:iron-containing alcohol dehydrogenase [Escherichia coli]HAN2974105.1 iron-containing alcohol dehydrogenase [Escherichia coli]